MSSEMTSNSNCCIFWILNQTPTPISSIFWYHNFCKIGAPLRRRIQSYNFHIVFSNSTTNKFSIKDYVLSTDWTPVKELFTLANLKCALLLLTSPIWLLLKLLVCFIEKVGGFKLAKMIFDFPWALLKFAFTNFFLASFDIYSDVLQGIKFIR